MKKQKEIKDNCFCFLNSPCVIQGMTEKVQFVSAKPYLNISDQEFDKLFFVLHGRKEVVVLCSDELKAELEALPHIHILPTLKEVKKHLDGKGIEYSEDFKNTTRV